MNFPIWDIPAPGLLIAAVAIVHVFISHFAVGGGLFLVLAERKARRDSDAALLAYVERHSKVFVLLTLVAGGLTGVGIWFTIALIHPSATASLIAIFVWAWAIEWTFFVVEIAAAMVYYYGWRRLAPATHLRVGWIYFWAAWLSLAAINGILAFMLTPGAWLRTRSIWDGLLNPTYLPSVAARTAAAVGLAGLYAVLTAAWLADRKARTRIVRYAAGRWVLPAALALPLAVGWYLMAAAGANVPVAETFGAAGSSLLAVTRSAFAASASGHPMAQRALVALLGASTLVVALTLVLLAQRTPRWLAGCAVVMMACGFVTLGSAEWIREDLRNPFIIGEYMFVNGVRLAPPPAVLRPPPGEAADPFAIDAVSRRGLLATALWTRPIDATGDPAAREIASGHELFRVSCTGCHTTDGYLAMRPLVKGLSVSAADTLLARLARPVDAAGHDAAWTTPNVRIVSWRGRRMPPFAGTPEERHALAMYLATLGGLSPADAARAESSTGAATFEQNCSVCHGAGSDWPFNGRRTAPEYYELIGRLPTVQDIMPPFEGSDTQRHELAEYLTTLQGGRPQGGAR